MKPIYKIIFFLFVMMGLAISCVADELPTDEAAMVDKYLVHWATIEGISFMTSVEVGPKDEASWIDVVSSAGDKANETIYKLNTEDARIELTYSFNDRTFTYEALSRDRDSFVMYFMCLKVMEGVMRNILQEEGVTYEAETVTFYDSRAVPPYKVKIILEEEKMLLSKEGQTYEMPMIGLKEEDLDFELVKDVNLMIFTYYSVRIMKDQFDLIMEAIKNPRHRRMPMPRSND